MNHFVLKIVATACVLAGFVSTPLHAQQAPIPVAVIGLEHGHAYRLFHELTLTQNLKLVGIVDPDKQLCERYAKQFHLAPELFFDTPEALWAKQKPKAVLVYTSIVEHRKAVEWAAAHGIDAMVEKPLATTLPDAIAMRDAARKAGTKLLVNYETTWYNSNTEVLNDVAAGKLGTVHKVVIHDGHEGPAEIGVGPEFLKWLADPVGNGAGAMFDFGCYGADLMTVMMHGAAPISVTAVAQTNKPNRYPKVDDDATIILRYPEAQAVLMPSWDWTFARKDMEVYGVTQMETAIDPDLVTIRTPKGKPETHAAPKLPLAYSDSLEYLAAVEQGRVSGEHDLTALDTNMVVMQILDAAKRSNKEGRTIQLTTLPH